MGVLQLHCKVAEGSGSLKILRYYSVGKRVLSQREDFLHEAVHPREVMLTFIDLPFFNKKMIPDKLYMKLMKKEHSKDSLLFPPESYKYVTFLLMD